jgi:hypothetical protein
MSTVGTMMSLSYLLYVPRVIDNNTVIIGRPLSLVSAQDGSLLFVAVTCDSDK